MRLIFCGTKLVVFAVRRPSANGLICEYFEQVLQDCKNGRRMTPTMPLAPLSDKGASAVNASLGVS